MSRGTKVRSVFFSSLLFSSDRRSPPLVSSRLLSLVTVPRELRNLNRRTERRKRVPSQFRGNDFIPDPGDEDTEAEDGYEPTPCRLAHPHVVARVGLVEVG